MTPTMIRLRAERANLLAAIARERNQYELDQVCATPGQQEEGGRALEAAMDALYTFDAEARRYLAAMGLEYRELTAR